MLKCENIKEGMKGSKLLIQDLSRDISKHTTPLICVYKAHKNVAFLSPRLSEGVLDLPH
jgi:hypothetical protein